MGEFDTWAPLKPDLFKCVKGRAWFRTTGCWIFKTTDYMCKYVFPNVIIRSYTNMHPLFTEHYTENIALPFREVAEITDRYGIESSGNNDNLSIVVPESTKHNIENICKELYEREKEKREEIEFNRAHEKALREKHEREAEEAFRDLKNVYCAGDVD